MSIVYATPPPAALATESADWVGLRPTWTGFDGSMWELSNPATGVLLARGGIRGLSMPPFTRYTSTGPVVAGSRWRGRRTVEREVFWPLFVFSRAGSATWVERDRAFWRTMHPDLPGTWTVTHPDGSSRSLRCRFVDDGSHAFNILPTVAGWARYGVTLVAEDPFWRGAPVLHGPWGVAGAATDFFDGGGPDFTISRGSSIDAATVENPGDEDASVVWVGRGPITSMTAGVGASTIAVPFSTAAGRMLVLDGSPSAQTAKDMPAAPVDATAQELLDWIEVNSAAATDRTRELTSAAWALIPRGGSVSLALSLVGTGSLQAIMRPAYHRAW